MTTYFGTGLTGFVGRALTRYLLSLEGTERITCLTRGVRPGYIDDPRVDYWLGDITDCDFPERSFDRIIHAASEANDLLAPDKMKYYYDVVEGSRRLFDWARDKSGIILYVSSGAVVKGNSTYCRAKRVSEQLVPSWAKIARIYSLVGPGLPLDGQYAIGRFIGQAIRDKEVRFYDSGSVRSYLHVDDCAKWLYAIMERGDDKLFGGTYDVGSDVSISVRDLAYLVARLADVPCVEIPRTDFHNTAQVYVPHIYRATQLGCKITTGLEDSIRDTIKKLTDSSE